MKKYLNEQQMAELDDLGLDTSDASDRGDGFPTYDLQDLIGKLPTTIDRATLEISPYWNAIWYREERTGRSVHCYKGELIDAAFEMLVWCVKVKHITF